jgi:hypothetical protein
MPVDPNVVRTRYHELARQTRLEQAHASLRAFENAVWSDNPSLFHDEIRWVRELAERETITPCDVLILLVGHSPEPLLLSVAHHRPQRVTFLYPRDGGVLDRLRKLWRAARPALREIGGSSWPLAAADLDVLEQPVGSPTRGAPFDDGNPAALFERVVEIVDAERKHDGAAIVLDITGAKKSMVAAAVVAAGDTDVATAYVDFESDYDATLRRPTPLSSRPGPFHNPYQSLSLRERGLLRSLFDQGRYAAVTELAGHLADEAGQPAMREVLGEARSVREAQALHHIARVAEAHRSWSGAFFADALRLAQEEGVDLPRTVAVLAESWPSEGADRETILASVAERVVLSNPARPLAYFLDVLAWTEASPADRPPRDEFLRLYGPLESFFCFACHAFLDVEILNARDYESRAEQVDIRPRGAAAPDWAAILREVVENGLLTNGAHALAALADGERHLRPQPDDLFRSPRFKAEFTKKSRSHFAKDDLPEVRYRNVGGPLSLGDYKRLRDGHDEEPGLNRFRHLRNKATHWLVPVPRAEVDALRHYFRVVIRSLLPAVRTALGERQGGDATEFAAALEALAGGDGGVVAKYGPRTYADVLEPG